MIAPGRTFEVDIALADGSGTVRATLEVLGPPSCGACADTGLVAPDAFGDWEPWLRYAIACEERARAEGWPPESSAIAAGLINPMPCPMCRRSEG